MMIETHLILCGTIRHTKNQWTDDFENLEKQEFGSVVCLAKQKNKDFILSTEINSKNHK